ncbi:D-alanyl-D-alanine carboxypeptidase [Aminipila butyrica]|uniref:serine-type D-Ala-D-Ala carboxypeptidase n=1 Tax=Aminipila butyrica TaxID=433296 RepID=A0A858BUA5_9FIRM|nr:D-alanyl-D-alanine carboxypeptidase family protein [Aminipila butyrica]QIB68364.1 D-alanyl-D-alanine carboxypeptidase [Aminipila butyrica]
MKKLITVMILLAALTGNWALSGLVFAETSGKETTKTSVITEAPSIVGETGALIDAKTGTVLYNKGMDLQREPASTTKIITGLLAIENLPLDKVVTIDGETPFTDGSRIYLIEGEQITVEDLLYALFLSSANDAAVALAIEMAGSVEDFAVMMNQKAKELGAKNTNFVNPNGLHADGHLTTSYDLAVIAKAAMENPTFRKYVTTYKHTIEPTNKQEEPRYLYNTNRLLYDEKTKVSVNGVLRTAKYDGVTGIKTGYTGQAGGCLVAGASRDGTELIAVVMKSTDSGRFGDSIALLDWGFENYHTVKLVDKGQELSTGKVTKGAEKTVSLVTARDGYVTLPTGQAADQIKTVVKTVDKLTAPLAKGQEAGSADFFQDGGLVGSVSLVSAEAVKEGGLFTGLGNFGKGLGKVAVVVLIAAAAVTSAAGGLLYIRHVNIKRRKLRRQQRALRAMNREKEQLYYNRGKYMNR